MSEPSCLMGRAERRCDPVGRLWWPCRLGSRSCGLLDLLCRHLDTAIILFDLGKCHFCRGDFYFEIRSRCVSFGSTQVFGCIFSLSSSAEISGTKTLAWWNWTRKLFQGDCDPVQPQVVLSLKIRLCDTYVRLNDTMFLW